MFDDIPLDIFEARICSIGDDIPNITLK